MNDMMDKSTKLQSLMELIKQMKALQGSSLKPQAVEVEISESKLPLHEGEEEMVEGESPDLSHEESPEKPQDVNDEEDHPEEEPQMGKLELPEALKALLMKKLSK